MRFKKAAQTSKFHQRIKVKSVPVAKAVAWLRARSVAASRLLIRSSRSNTNVIGLYEAMSHVCCVQGWPARSVFDPKSLLLQRVRSAHNFFYVMRANRDLETYQRCANSLRRLLEAVGLQRRPRDISPTLSEIAREIEAEKLNAEDVT
jgi:hypothetical protein